MELTRYGGNDDMDVNESSQTASTATDQKDRIQRFLDSPYAVTYRGFTAISSYDLDPIDETYPETWCDWLTNPTAELPYQLYQIETPTPEGRQQPPRPLKDLNGRVVQGRQGRYLRQVHLPRQIKSTEAMFVLVAFQDIDWRIKPTDIVDRMYRTPIEDTPEEDDRLKTLLSQKMRDCREAHHKLSIHPKRTQPSLPAKSELEAVDCLEPVNIKYNFVGVDCGRGCFSPFPGGPVYRYPNPTGIISQKMRDIVRELENARGWVHHGGYRHWKDLPIYPGDFKNGLARNVEVVGKAAVIRAKEEDSEEDEEGYDEEEEEESEEEDDSDDNDTVEGNESMTGNGEDIDGETDEAVGDMEDSE